MKQVIPETCRRLATSSDEAEVALNDGFGCTHQLITATATATSAMSNGTETVRMTNKTFYEKPLTLLTNMLCEEDREGCELVTVEDSWKEVEDMESKDEGVGMGSVALLEGVRGLQSL